MRWLIHCVFCVLLFAASALRADTVLRFCYDPYPPYTIQESGQPLTGLKVTVLAEVVALIDGVDAQVELMPWARCQDAVRQGQLDGILPLFQNDERRTYMAFTNPVFLQESTVFYRASQFPDQLAWGGEADIIAHLRLGMLRGSYIDESFEDAFRAHRGIQRGSSVDALFLMLLNERVDLIAVDTSVGRYVARQMGVTKQVGWAQHPITEKPSYFGLSRKTGADAHLEAFNAALETLRASGGLWEIEQSAP